MARIAWVSLLLAACATPRPVPPVEVAVEEGRRETAYALYFPQERWPRRPAVVLLHGFSRSHRQLENHARALAARGFVVLAPDALSLLLPGGRQRNVEAVVGHLRWLVARAEDPADALYRRVDPARLGIAGHSAGGALAVMAAAAAQDGPLPLRAIALLDAVPWPETIEAARGLRPLPVASLRSEPSASNAWGMVSELLHALSFAVVDARIVGASHIDPENPTDILARTFAGPLHPECQELYRRLLVAFLEQELAGAADRPFDRALREAETSGSVALASASRTAGGRVP